MVTFTWESPEDFLMKIDETIDHLMGIADSIEQGLNKSTEKRAPTIASYLKERLNGQILPKL